MTFYYRLAAILVFLLTIPNAFAGIRQDNVIPPTFAINGQTITPSKISEIYVHYIFDVAKQTVSAHSKVKFTAIANGMPFMDLVPSPQKISFNGVPINPDDFYEAKTPDKETTVRVLNRFLIAGEKGELDIEYNLSSNVLFKKEGVGAGFFMTDLEDRGFFEKYGPANFEFNHIAFTFDVDVIGTAKPHEVFTNGTMTKDPEGNHWHIVFPNYFTSSSLFFHLAPKGTFAVQHGVFESINKKQIPMIFFSPQDSLAKKGLQNAKEYLAEFEGIFGAFAHNQVVGYITPYGGGMEYPGATITSLYALRHELNHSWFARCIMPASGNAGWIDEAIASWSDDGFPRANKLPNREAVNMAGRAPFTRKTSTLAYSLGRDFIAELDLVFKDIGGMKKFLTTYYNTYQYQVVSTAMMQQLAEEFYGQSLSPLFDRYVFGIDKNQSVVAKISTDEIVNPYHVKLSDAQLRNLILPSKQ